MTIDPALQRSCSTRNLSMRRRVQPSCISLAAMHLKRHRLTEASEAAGPLGRCPSTLGTAERWNCKGRDARQRVSDCRER
jgi:hypothetical protein